MTNKYTIKKAFEKDFPHAIWKIEVDCAQEAIAVECRDASSTMPSFSVFSFDGRDLLPPYQLEEKEWTVDTLKGDFLILKKYGSYSPIQSGICVIHIPTRSIVFTYLEYILVEVHNNYIKARHRSIPSGIEFYIDIASGEVHHTSPISTDHVVQQIHYPVAFQGKIPSFMHDISVIDNIWIQPYEDLFLWAYHSPNDQTFDLHLCLSDKSQVLDSKKILNNLDKLIPQPYFEVKGHIFFLSNSKQEIVSYLV